MAQDIIPKPRSGFVNKSLFKYSEENLRKKLKRLEERQQEEIENARKGCLVSKTSGIIFLIISIISFLAIVLYPLDTEDFSYQMSHFNGAVLAILFLLMMFTGGTAYQILTGKHRRKLEEAINKRQTKIDEIKLILAGKIIED